MPVTFRKRAKPSAPAIPVVPSVTNVPLVVAARPTFTKTLHVGNADILPDIDLHDVPGRTKFLVNMHKTENGSAIWYRVVGYDENTGQMKLCSRHAHPFDAKSYPSIALHYMVVMEGKEAVSPSKEVLKEIKKMMTADPIQPVEDKKK